MCKSSLTKKRDSENDKRRAASECQLVHVSHIEQSDRKQSDVECGYARTEAGYRGDTDKIKNQKQPVYKGPTRGRSTVS